MFFFCFFVFFLADRVDEKERMVRRGLVFVVL